MDNPDNFSSRQWVVFSIILLVTAIGWIWISRTTPDPAYAGNIPIPRQGFQAPDFRLNTIFGEDITLSNLNGKPVLINFWASWCPPCVAEMPAIQKIYQEYGNEGFIVLAVNASNQDNLNNAVKFVEKNNLKFPILLDSDGQVSNQYLVQSLPTSFFIDRSGKIQEIVIGGPMAESLLRIRVEKLLR